jgi:phosphoglycolate phosphatase-like HAD superfamily hydrolase
VSRQPLNVGRVQAILFDLDGTLADTHETLAARLAEGLRTVAWLFPSRDPRPFARRLLLATESPTNFLYALADRLALDEVAAPLLDIVHSMRGEARRQGFQLLPGIRAMLHRLHPIYRLGIVSARTSHGVAAFLAESGLQPLIDCAASARTCRRSKPHPAPVLWAAQQLGVPPQACLMVGDTTVDIRAGRTAGAQTVGVLCGFGEREELEKAYATVILPSTCDLLHLLVPR